MTTAMKPHVTPRAEETRKRIYEAALELFRENGFEQTTMRDIARKADVALGGAYYYFSSKEAIVLAFYHEMQQSNHDQILELMDKSKKLKDRLRTIIEKRLELLMPNRRFCDALFRHAPDSTDPLSPFSEETHSIRERAIQHMQIAVEGSDTRMPPDLKRHLPYLLWLYQMAIILFWLYDRSSGQQRTKKLIDLSLGLVVSLIKISGLPLMRPMRKTVLELVETVTP